MISIVNFDNKSYIRKLTKILDFYTNKILKEVYYIKIKAFTSFNGKEKS